MVMSYKKFGDWNKGHVDFVSVREHTLLFSYIS